MKRWPVIFLLSLCIAGHPGRIWANPTQYGDTGLLTQPSAETLNAGNLCIGVWANHSAGTGDNSDALIIPATITMGLGTFMEVYGSYPNLLFNDDELQSGRGFANIGFKFRVLGKRSSPFKLALDTQLRRGISDDPNFDGLTDYLGRVIATYKPGKFGVHLNAGYLNNESPPDLEYDDQYVFGGGIEFLPVYRLRLIAEVEAQTEKLKGSDAPLEATLGLQYFVMPHLTVNLGVGVGLSDGSPDWRALVGFTGCQGVGNYITPIARVTEPGAEQSDAEKTEPEKKIKLKTLTPLLSLGMDQSSPVAKLERPVDSPAPEVTLTPAEQLKVSTKPVLEGLAVAPLDNVDSGAETNPPAKPIRAGVYRKFQLPETTFTSDQRTLSEEGKQNLSLIAETLRNERKWLIVRLDGHTDNVGPDQYNEELSVNRATAAATYLALRDGIEPNRLFVKGFGESQPVADNGTPEGRGENRRLELLVLNPREVAE